MRIIRRQEVQDRKLGGCGKSTLYRLIRHHGFPKGIRLGPGLVGWDEQEVDRWLAERAAEREKEAA